MKHDMASGFKEIVDLSMIDNKEELGKKMLKWNMKIFTQQECCCES